MVTTKQEIEQRIKKNTKLIPNFRNKGVEFKDINGIFLDYQLCDDIATILSFYTNGKHTPIPDAICGIESRGFFFGILIAQKLKIPLFMARKKGKLATETISIKYDLEYGSDELEMETGVIKKGWNVMV